MDQELLVKAGVIVGALIAFGTYLKQGVPSLPNRAIPLMIALIGTGLTIWWSGNHTAAGIITAFSVSMTAIGIHSGVKNTFEDRPEAPAKK